MITAQRMGSLVSQSDFPIFAVTHHLLRGNLLGSIGKGVLIIDGADAVALHLHILHIDCHHSCTFGTTPTQMLTQRLLHVEHLSRIHLHAPIHPLQIGIIILFVQCLQRILQHSLWSAFLVLTRHQAQHQANYQNQFQLHHSNR